MKLYSPHPEFCLGVCIRDGRVENGLFVFRFRYYLNSRNDLRLFSSGGHFCLASTSKMLEGELGGRFERDMIVFVTDKDASSSQSSSHLGLHALNQLEKKDDDTGDKER
jgi:hypothetical protein